MGTWGDIPQGARVLDVFAGSGALGIEALSRGALHCVFVEQSRGALRTLHENLAALSIADRSTVVPGDAFGSAVAARGPFDLVLADPPYRDGVEQRLVEEMGRRLTFGGVLALEHAMDRPAPETEGLAVWKARRYGGTLLTLYVRAAEENS